MGSLGLRALADPAWVWRFPALVVRVIDGDTFEFMIDQGLRARRQETVRLVAKGNRPIDAYEIHARDPAERKLAQLGRLRAEELLLPAPVVLITYRPEGFGRWLAEVLLSDGRDLGEILLAEGLARPWIPG